MQIYIVNKDWKKQTLFHIQERQPTSDEMISVFNQPTPSKRCNDAIVLAWDYESVQENSAFATALYRAVGGDNVG